MTKSSLAGGVQPTTRTILIRMRQNETLRLKGIVVPEQNYVKPKRLENTGDSFNDVITYCEFRRTSKRSNNSC